MKLRDKKGFTLIEGVISIIVTAIIAIALFSSLTTIFNTLRYRKEFRTASLILQEEVSIVRDMDFSDIKTMGTSFTLPNMSLLSNATGTIDQSLYGGEDTLIKITFDLDWTGFNGKPQNRSITTIMGEDGLNKK